MPKLCSAHPAAVATALALVFAAFGYMEYMLRIPTAVFGPGNRARIASLV